jgi:hydrogenase nickel incorporation protein HypA/HybF
VHELGITRGIVELVAERAAGARVNVVRLEIGKLSAVMPDAIRFCFDLCAQGTALDGAQLEIIEIPGRGCCRQCGAELAMDDFLVRCECGSIDIECIGGEQLNIKEMEVA